MAALALVKPNQQSTQLKQRRRHPSTYPNVLSSHAGAWQYLKHHGKEHGGDAHDQRGVGHIDQRLAGGQLALGPLAKGAQAGADDQRDLQEKLQSQNQSQGQQARAQQRPYTA